MTEGQTGQRIKIGRWMEQMNGRDLSGRGIRRGGADNHEPSDLGRTDLMAARWKRCAGFNPPGWADG